MDSLEARGIGGEERLRLFRVRFLGTAKVKAFSDEEVHERLSEELLACPWDFDLEICEVQ